MSAVKVFPGAPVELAPAEIAVALIEDDAGSLKSVLYVRCVENDADARMVAHVELSMDDAVDLARRLLGSVGLSWRR